MGDIHKFPFCPPLGEISFEIHQDITQLLNRYKPQAKYLSEEAELEQLYYAWILIRAEKLSFSEEDGFIEVKVSP